MANCKSQLHSLYSLPNTIRMIGNPEGMRLDGRWVVTIKMNLKTRNGKAWNGTR